MELQLRMVVPVIGIPDVVDDMNQMEERIEDYYQEKCSWTMKDLAQLFDL